MVERIIEENPFEDEDDEEAALTASAPTEKDHELLRSTLRQFVRDWSSAGTPERDATYGPILNALNIHFKDLTPEAR